MLNEQAIIETVRGWVKEIALSPDDFKGRGPGKITPAHDKVVNALVDAWIKSKGVGQVSQVFGTWDAKPKGGAGIDFIGRKGPYAQILLAIEVDISYYDPWPPTESWKKLADTISATKVWLCIDSIDNHEDATSLFELAKRRFQAFLNDYGDIKEGEIFVFYKTPAIFWEGRLP